MTRYNNKYDNKHFEKELIKISIYFANNWAMLDAKQSLCLRDIIDHEHEGTRQKYQSSEQKMSGRSHEDHASYECVSNLWRQIG